MPGKALGAMAAALILVVGWANVAVADLGGGHSSTSPPAVVAWAASEVGGGVPPPPGTSVCGPWAPAANFVPDVTPIDFGPVRQTVNGTDLQLYQRQCDGITQTVWVPVLSPRDLALMAANEVERRLPQPSLALSPAAVPGGVVNLEEWLAVADPGAVAATAAIPGLSVTVTASPASMVWDMGNHDVVRCAGLGSQWRPGLGDGARPSCGYTYRWYSADRPGDRYQVSVTLAWSVAWVGTDGTSGVLGDLSTVTGFGFRVREIQTVEVAG